MGVPYISLVVDIAAKLTSILFLEERKRHMEVEGSERYCMLNARVRPSSNAAQE